MNWIIRKLRESTYHFNSRHRIHFVLCLPNDCYLQFPPVCTVYYLSNGFIQSREIRSIYSASTCIYDSKIIFFTSKLVAPSHYRSRQKLCRHSHNSIVSYFFPVPIIERKSLKIQLKKFSNQFVQRKICKLLSPFYWNISFWPYKIFNTSFKW